MLHIGMVLIVLLVLYQIFGIMLLCNVYLVQVDHFMILQNYNVLLAQLDLLLITLVIFVSRVYQMEQLILIIVHLLHHIGMANNVLIATYLTIGIIMLIAAWPAQLEQIMIPYKNYVLLAQQVKVMISPYIHVL
jgi:hypothetical protein